MKVFLDTNVWLSATVFSGLCEALLLACADRGWLVTSPLVQTGAHAVLGRKFPHLPQATALFDAVWHEASLVSDAPGPLDDNDGRLIATAQTARASWFITGDRRVLGWAPPPGLRIAAPRAAWAALFAHGGP